VVGFTSILYPGSGTMTAVDAPPDCFSDLHIDEIVARATAGHGDDQLDRFFFAPLHEVVAVGPTYRDLPQFVDDMVENVEMRGVFAIGEGVRYRFGPRLQSKRDVPAGS
jgi:hypothetical protein